MTNPLTTGRAIRGRPSCWKLVAPLLTALLGALHATAHGATPISPQLFTVSATSTRAVVLESVSMRPEPFSLSSEANFSPNDPRTRITLFCMNLDLLSDESASALSADAEDAAHVQYPLKVEYVGQVPGFAGIYMVVLRLSDLMPASLGDVLVRLNLHGMASNRVRVGIGQIGGGPDDDSAPSPAPAIPPAAVTPMTLAQYQAQYDNPNFASDNDLKRFLEQSSWGQRGDDADFNHLRAIGISAYLNEQLNMPPPFVDSSNSKFFLSSDYPLMTVYPEFYPKTSPPCDPTTTCFRDNYTLYPLQKQFMMNALTQPDQLRQRIGFAFHKFIVVDGTLLNNNEASFYAPYLQTIDRNSFGNFRQMLYDITLNAAMGQYLHLRGNSVIDRNNPTPNENYAREIMHLFSVGVDTLNQDGTPVLDANGIRVPTYDQTTVTNLARVFTGWDTGQVIPWGDGFNYSDNYRDPLVPNGNPNRYDINQKTLLTDIRSANPVTIPACGSPCAGFTQQSLIATQQYAVDSLGKAIDNLFYHPNTGPYVCVQLIHQLVTSNPTPAYVGRCAAAFANNGGGVRGDMKAVIKSIFLDPEARGDVKTDPNYGHLREPVLLMTHVLRAFNVTDASKTDGVLVTSVSPGSFSAPLGQPLFNPPTVFGYFPADFYLPGTNLFAPEFGSLEASVSLGRANFMNTLFVANGGSGIPANGANRPVGTQITFASYLNLTSQQLVDALNARLMHGTMSAPMNAAIVAAVNGIPNSTALQRAQTAAYLVTTSSQYQVEQ